MKEKICKLCGEKFVPKSSRQIYCMKDIPATCPICGRSFMQKCQVNGNSATCGTKECRDKYALQKRILAFPVKKCEWCGEDFRPRSNTQKYCDREHYSICEICGTQFTVDLKVNKADIRRTCSDECAKKLVSLHNAMHNPEVVGKLKQSMLEKYGVASPAQLPEVVARMQTTTLERYGNTSYVRTQEYHDKVSATSQERYGVDWFSQSPEVKAKAVATNEERYGAAYPLQNPELLSEFQDKLEESTGYRSPLSNPEIREKATAIIQERYGVEHYSQTEEFLSKFQQTSLEHFGVPNPMQSKEVQERSTQTNLLKYGATNFLASEEGRALARKRMEEIYGSTHFSCTKEWKEKLIKCCTNIDEWLVFTQDPDKYLQENFELFPTYLKVATHIGVPVSTLYDFALRRNIRDRFALSMSYMEEEVAEFLDSLNVKYRIHERKIIAPLELDFYLPDYRIAIECNPTATHNSSIPFRNMSIPATPVRYHENKTNKCEELGITLFHIFGYEWSHKKEIIKSMLQNLLRKNTTTVYARKCEIKEVSWEESVRFLNENHRQGAANSPIRLGLFYQNELVSLMTFGKMRATIGIDHNISDNCYELVRFCSKLNTSVTGGASKLFNHFIDTFKPSFVRSFSDRAHTKGTLYSTLGFQEIRRADPGYVWVDLTTDEGYNRVNAQKQNLKKFLKDDSLDLSLSEKQIMIEHGFVQVFDSGTITWEWKNA